MYKRDKTQTETQQLIVCCVNIGLVVEVFNEVGIKLVISPFNDKQCYNRPNDVLYIK